MAAMLLELPPEIILHIFSYLDLPELSALSKLSLGLASLAADPVLQRFRLLVVAPSRVQHALYGVSSQGIALRPTVGDLVHRGVIRGLGVERRWRLGMYIYSPFSVKQYENLLKLQRRHTCDVLSIHFRQRSSAQKKVLNALRDARVLPDAESLSFTISRSLIPVMHKLKWSIQRDRLAQMVRDKGLVPRGLDGPAAWLDAKGRTVMIESERVRLALCPGVRKIVKFYEGLGR
ncbi:hypothetical protein NEOLEDRAFT_1083387 [Neolentinus lepideus HHB14362 ss-1]|uniref:F-box domain-containing protein n=1 Tax=Neolentinus lepideus HHB14362 ss-1 TaxID=1314782 RepID=A0A165W9S2_9AGAM|nr:hypothetical protein NEOLEDRAFT_1083387 [Neolentinus lepideus HHB14362 ss-1]